MGGAKAYLTAGLLFLFPTFLVRGLANLLGARIAPGARVGFSLLVAEEISLGRKARIGHFNLIRIRRIRLLRESKVKHLNLARGPFSLELGRGAIFSSLNRIVRGARGLSIGESRFRMYPRSGVTSGHYFDVMKPIEFGRHSIVAGTGCQFWTHGYVHETEGPGRYRIDGPIVVGANVYVGSRVLVSLGVTIGAGTVVGAGAVVASDLEGESLYVPAGLRKLPRPADPDQRAVLVGVPPELSLDRVYIRIKRS